MDFASYLGTLGVSGQHLAMRDLKPLSDMDPAERAAFLASWRTIEPARRGEIVHAMVDLAEDNVDLQFQTVMFWCLEDDDAAVRATAIEGLWESESSQVLHRLLGLLRNDPSADVRATAAIGLSRFAYLAEMGELDESQSTLLLRALLSTISDQRQPVEVRRRAIESVGYYAGEAEVIRQIEQAHSADDTDLRESALVAMGRSMLPRWIPTIARELENRSPAIRYEAARAAGELGEEGRPLIVRVARLLGDSDTEVALAAIWALGQIGGEAASRALKEASKSESDARAQAAVEALAELTLDDGITGTLPGRFPRGGSRN